MAKKRKRRRPPSENHNRLEVSPAMPRRHVQLTAEMWAVLDDLRGSQAYGVWLEEFLRRHRRIKQTAVELGLEFRQRNRQGRPRVRDYDNQRRTR